MSRKMTVVFHDEDLYTCLKVEAAKLHIPASEIIAAAVTEWLGSREYTELPPAIEILPRRMEREGWPPLV
jgi:hypothetical protein